MLGKESAKHLRTPAVKEISGSMHEKERPWSVEKHENDQIVNMKTIRLLYPDYVSGGLETYYFGANLLQHILPSNPDQSTIKVDILPPDGKEKQITNGIYAEEEVLAGIKNAQEKLSEEKPDQGDHDRRNLYRVARSF